MITDKLISQIKDKLAVEANYIFFFEHLTKSDWVGPLLKAGFFKNPPDPIFLDDGGVISPIWYESRYLLRVADQVPNEIMNIFAQLPDTKNRNVIEDLIQILLKLDTKKGVRFTNKVIKFLDVPYESRIERFATDLAVKFMKDGHISPALLIVESMLEVKPDPKVSSMSDEELRRTFIQPRIKYRPYEYEKIIETITPVLTSLASDRAVILYSDLLEKAIDYKVIKSANDWDDDEGPWEDYSSIWRPDISIDRHIQDQPRQGLISGLRDSLIGLMQSDLADDQKLVHLGTVVGKPYKVFGRTVEYVLREYKENETFKPLYERLYQDVKPITDVTTLEKDPSFFVSEIDITHEDLVSLSNEQFIEKLKTYEPSINTPFFRDDVADLVGGVIKSDIRRYIKLSDQFSGLKKQYIHSLISAADEKLDELDVSDISQVLDLGAAFLKLQNQGDQYDGWSRMALARFIYKVTHQKNDKSEYLFPDHSETVLKLILQLTRDADPTPEHEEQYGGKNMDPATLSLNTIRGEAMHALVHFGMWARRNKIKEEIITEIYKELDWHLDSENDPSLTIRSVYGYELPWIWVINKKWLEGHVLQIFTSDEQGDSAWDAYVGLNQAYTDLLPVIKPVIEERLKGLVHYEDDNKDIRDARSQFVHHLMIYYWSGHLDLAENGLVQTFFETADIRYRAEALHFVGFELRKLCEEGKQIENTVLERLRSLWNYRLEKVQSSPALGTKELEEFGSWFASGAYDNHWSIENLSRVLLITHVAEPDFMVLERLSEIAGEFPSESIKCLRELIIGARERWSIDSWREEAMIIIKSALHSGNEEAKRIGEEQANKLVSMGYLSFRDSIK